MNARTTFPPTARIPFLDPRDLTDIVFDVASGAKPFDWAASNARLDQSAANTTAIIEQMRAGHAADAVFQERWNAMSYREAVEFQRARTQEPNPC